MLPGNILYKEIKFYNIFFLFKVSFDKHAYYKNLQNSFQQLS